MKRIIYSIFILFLLSSCSTIRETHYFKDKIDSNGDISINSSVSNYYKVNIKGWAFMSSSRYVSGYFNEDVVNEYFNEITQPENGKLIPVVNKPDSGEQGQETSKKSEPINSKTETGSELVLLLSTNAEAIATEIKNTATNKDVLQSLTLLANKDKIKKVKEVESKLKETDISIDLFILKIDTYLNSIDESAPTENDKKILFQLLKGELRTQGIKRGFTDFNQLKEWYHENY